MKTQQWLAGVFVELADTLVEDFDAVDLLQTLADRTVKLLEVDAAGLMLADQHGELQLMASTLERARLLELFELQVAAAGFRATHALPMQLRGQIIGVLNLFADDAVPLSQDDVAVGQAMADVATIGLLSQRSLFEQVRLSEQLQTALQSRILIEQAKGFLSARARISVNKAFHQMRTHARGTGVTLSLVATRVIEGTIDLSALTGG